MCTDVGAVVDSNGEITSELLEGQRWPGSQVSFLFICILSHFFTPMLWPKLNFSLALGLNKRKK